MLTVERATWDRTAADHLGAIQAAVPVDFYRGEAETGGPLLAVLDRGERVGTVLLRFEAGELVIVGAGGRWRDGALAPVVLPVIEGEAARVGCASIRFHTERPGLVRFGERRGYRARERRGREVVMAKLLGVPDGRSV